MHAVVILAAFLLGSIPSGILLSRLHGLSDPRTIGSGNIGASNMTRLGGKKLGALTLLCDALKGLILVVPLKIYLPDATYLPAIAGAMAILGHCYSIFLRFRGGKGVATAAGVLLFLAPAPTAIGLATWLIIFLVTRITSFAALTSAIVIPTVMLFLGTPYPELFLAIFAALIIFRRHETNIESLLHGRERSF